MIEYFKGFFEWYPWYLYVGNILINSILVIWAARRAWKHVEEEEK